LVTNYQLKLSNTPEVRRPQLHYGGSVEPRMVTFVRPSCREVDNIKIGYKSRTLSRYYLYRRYMLLHIFFRVSWKIVI